MIYTNQDRGVCLYDRKSPRHNWRLVVCAESEEHARAQARYWQSQAAKSKGWEQYQQQITSMHFEGGVIPDNLPRNYTFEGAI